MVQTKAAILQDGYEKAVEKWEAWLVRICEAGGGPQTDILQDIHRADSLSR